MFPPQPQPAHSKYAQQETFLHKSQQYIQHHKNLKSLAWFYQKLCVFQHTKRRLYTGRIIHIPPASPHWELANTPVHLGSSRATIGASPSSGSSIPSRLRHGAGTEHFQAHLTPLDEMLRFQHPRPKKKKLSPATPSSSVAIFEVHRLNCRRLQTHLLSFCSAIWHLCIRRRLHICQMGKNIFSCNSCRNGEGGGNIKKKINPVDHMEGFFLSNPS